MFFYSKNAFQCTFLIDWLMSSHELANIRHTNHQLRLHRLNLFRSLSFYTYRANQQRAVQLHIDRTMIDNCDRSSRSGRQLAVSALTSPSKDQSPPSHEPRWKGRTWWATLCARSFCVHNRNENNQSGKEKHGQCALASHGFSHVVWLILAPNHCNRNLVLNGIMVGAWWRSTVDAVVVWCLWVCTCADKCTFPVACRCRGNALRVRFVWLDAN